MLVGFFKPYLKDQPNNRELVVVIKQFIVISVYLFVDIAKSYQMLCRCGPIMTQLGGAVYVISHMRNCILC